MRPRACWSSGSRKRRRRLLPWASSKLQDIALNLIRGGGRVPPPRSLCFCRPAGGECRFTTKEDTMFSFERMLKIWEKYGHMYWNGLGYTLLFAFVSVLMGLVLGLVLASGRMGQRTVPRQSGSQGAQGCCQIFLYRICGGVPCHADAGAGVHHLLRSGQCFQAAGFQPQPHVLGHGGRRPQLRGLYVGGHPLRHRRGAGGRWRPRAASA